MMNICGGFHADTLKYLKTLYETAKRNMPNTPSNWYHSCCAQLHFCLKRFISHIISQTEDNLLSFYRREWVGPVHNTPVKQGVLESMILMDKILMQYLCVSSWLIEVFLVCHKYIRYLYLINI